MKPGITAERCLAIAEGCHDYGGGYRTREEAEIYHHGISTVVNCLRHFLDGDTSLQIRVVESVGYNALKAEREKTYQEPTK
jgi:hypothetical protein